MDLRRRLAKLESLFTETSRRPVSTDLRVVIVSEDGDPAPDDPGRLLLDGEAAEAVLAYHLEEATP